LFYAASLRFGPTFRDGSATEGSGGKNLGARNFQRRLFFERRGEKKVGYRIGSATARMKRFWMA